MSFINYKSKEIVLKIVYYGPGLCGKTTNVKYIYSATNDETKGKLISLETQQERTLYFDFLPIELPTIRGFKTRLHLYTVPGQLFYSNSRRLIMKNADGVVFVADSQAERLEANLISMDDLLDNLEDSFRHPVQQARPAECASRRAASQRAQPLVSESSRFRSLCRRRPWRL